jgi:hypothetical protein
MVTGISKTLDHNEPFEFEFTCKSHQYPVILKNLYKILSCKLASKSKEVGIKGTRSRCITPYLDWHASEPSCVREFKLEGYGVNVKHM